MINESLISELLSQVWFHFFLAILFGFLTGLEFREYSQSRDKEKPAASVSRLGSSRTFTFISILGFVLYILDPAFRLYLAGMIGLILFLVLFYHHKLETGKTGLLQPLMALLVYTYGPVITLLPPWFLVLLFVSVVFTLSARPLAHRLTASLDHREIPTLAKFLLLSGVILPLLPDQIISPYIPASPFKIWMAIVLISGISYAGYILKKYLLKRQGYLVTGMLGGLYSSTATTVVLARKSRSLSRPDPGLNAGIIAATGMMYLRLLALIAIMNYQLLSYAALPLLLFGLFCIGSAIFIYRKASTSNEVTPELGHSNPLELGIALLFAVLFVVMMVITQQVIAYFGKTGLELLSFGVGFTDIDPFVLSILSGHYEAMNLQQLAGAIVIAAGSNNLLKGIYAVGLGGPKNNGKVSILLITMGILTIGYGLVL